MKKVINPKISENEIELSRILSYTSIAIYNKRQKKAGILEPHHNQKGSFIIKYAGISDYDYLVEDKDWKATVKYALGYPDEYEIYSFEN